MSCGVYDTFFQTEPNVFIGGGTATTDPINPEVPEWLENAIFIVGIGCALVLAGPLVVAVGMAGAYLGGRAAHLGGGELFGEGSDGQKISTLAGALIGGGIAARGGVGFERNHVFTSKGFGSNLGNVGVRSKTASDKPSAWSSFKYRRGKFHKGVREEVWNNAKNSEGVVRDPVTNTVMSKNEPWDMGHKPGYEHWKHVRSAEQRGLARKEFIDEFNQAGHYRPELPSSNRSHAGEIKSDLYLGP
ncbi:HNH/ENDO VII family nuclease [Pseudomonas sp. NY15354]|uniref:HNH/ENDO VII family nuclease n=1 Tax=Pseudomonas sp. NY15354 TaxID=3400351 RepID=UPI003A86D608